MSYRLDVLRACCLMFPHDFKNLNAVMLLSWLKDSKDSVIDYKTTNLMSFLAVLLSQSAFNFLNWLFHKCFGLKTRQIITYPLLSVRCKVQDEDYNTHDPSQRKSYKFHHNILYFWHLHFLDCKFHILHMHVLTSFQGANETHLTKDES